MGPSSPTDDGEGRVNRRNGYRILAMASLGVSAAGVGLAAAAAALQQVLGAGSAALCAALFLVPGLYFLGHSRRLESRDLALAHAASFVAGHDTIRIQDLAAELGVPPGDADRILRTAVREGHLRGRFEAPDRFVPERTEPRRPEGAA